MKNYEAILGGRFPIRFLTIAVILTGAVLVWLGFNTYNSYSVIKTTRDRDFRIKELRGIIIHLDEVLTMSARMAAATGDLGWEERYRLFEPQLDAAIKEAIRLAPGAYSGEAAVQTDAANIKLVEMENRSFDLVRLGRLEEARDVLFSNEYETQKRIYAQGIELFASLLNDAASATLQSEQNRAFLNIIIVIVVAPTLVVGWLVVLRTLNNWRMILSENNSRLARQTDELVELNESLDQKVAKRTEELESARVAALNMMKDAEEARVKAERASEELMKEIAERKQAEEALRESEERFRILFEHSPDALLLIDPHSTRAPSEIIDCNEVACRMNGYSREELIGQPIGILNLTKGDEEERAAYLERLRREGGMKYEVHHRRKDGSVFPIEVSTSLITLAGRELILGIDRDITERKRAEESLRESKEQSRLIIETAADALVGMDDRGFIIAWNRQAEIAFGWPRSEAIGRKMSETIIPPQYREAHTKGLERFLATGEGPVLHKRIEITALHRDGRQFPVELTVWPVKMGESYAFNAFVRDITERKEVDRLKSEFVSVVSHELRTPLTSIVGSLGLISGGVAGELPAQAKTLIDIAHKNSERLVRLINDILDVEKIESGKMVFNIKPMELMPLIEQSVEANKGYGERYKVRFVLKDALPGVKVAADSDRLIQVVTNLLSNAAKFSPPGGTVDVSVSQHKGSIRVSVTDHGPGIPEEFRSRIFQKFAQADSSDSRQKGGTGLGLSICKAIVEKLGGKIGFETEMGVGTTFYFDLSGWHEEGVRVSPSTDLEGRPRVLICEDDVDIANLLKMMLDQGGFATDIAHSASQAKKLLSENHYSAMTLDLVLPDQDGISLIRELRAQEGTSHLPIVVVSVEAQEGRGELNGDVFMVIDWLGKPIDRRRLTEAVKRATEQRTLTKPRILYIEDNFDLVQVVSAVLSDAADVSYALNIQDATEKLGREAFDLIILDLTLPDGSGLDLLPLLRSHAPPIPVVVFSAQEIDIETAKDVTAALVKSRTSNQELLDTIRGVIGREGADSQ
jgi:PAS domain S-box-containing protein